MAHPLGAVRALECRPRRLASTQGHQARTRGRPSLEAIDRAMHVRLQRPPSPQKEARPTSMLHSLRATGYGRRTTLRLQGCARRALADLQACAILRHTYISPVLQTNPVLTRTLGVDNSETRTVEAHLGGSFRRCIQIRATSLKLMSSKEVLGTSNGHHLKLQILRLRPGIRTPSQPHLPSKTLLHLEMSPTVSRAGAKRAST
jgi:hypothetical protein